MICSCGCGATAELFYDDTVIEDNPINVRAFDQVKICRTQEVQVFPRGHLIFTIFEDGYSKSSYRHYNSSIIYNRFGDVVSKGAFNDLGCPCGVRKDSV